MKRVVNSRENERAQRFEAGVGCELRSTTKKTSKSNFPRSLNNTITFVE